MADCFISYSSVDERFASQVHRHLEQLGLSVFMAKISLKPGDNWTKAIYAALDDAGWVIFLASRRACNSPYVQQEIGRAVNTSKKFIPVVWDMPPEELPGWANQYQALDIRGKTGEEVASRITQLADRIKASKRNGALVAGGLVIAFFVLFGGKE